MVRLERAGLGSGIVLQAGRRETPAAIYDTRDHCNTYHYHALLRPLLFYAHLTE